MNDKIDRTVEYNRAFALLKSMWQKGILELEICNDALVGIAKELGVLNPILL